MKVANQKAGMMELQDLRTPFVALFVCTMSLAVCGCDESSKYPKNIREFPDSWQALDPGKPIERFPRIEIQKQGVGSIVEPGDLVQLGIKAVKLPEGTQDERGDWWVWIGFRSPQETAFFAFERDVSGSLLGLRQGTLLRFLEGSEVHKFINGVSAVDRSGQLKLQPNPFGDPKYYSWRKNTTEFMGFGGTPSNFGYSILEIKRVCKGQAQYRTVRLFDDGPVQIVRGLNTSISHEPREMWIDEARIEAQCQDGRKAYFQYGPIPSPGRGGRSPVVGYFDDWFQGAWKKIPLGVQFVGNQPPVAKEDKFTTHENAPVKIDIFANDTDPDGDRLTARIMKDPRNGTLTANADNTYTYTPTNECRRDEFRYRASDGLVESDEVSVIIDITRDKPADPKLLRNC